jgi:hypothetical protein
MVAFSSPIIAGILFCIGPLVPISYYKLRSLSHNELFGGIHDITSRRMWLTSALLSVIAFLYMCMFILFLIDTRNTSVFGVGLDDAGDIIIAGCLLMILLPSLGWSTSVIRDSTIHHGQSFPSVVTRFILWTVAFASWVLISQIVSISKSDGWGNRCVTAVVASIVFSFHVTVFDAYLWCKRSTLDTQTYIPKYIPNVSIYLPIYRLTMISIQTYTNA